MSIEKPMSKLKISDEFDGIVYEYIDVFQNPFNLPITQIHIEKTWRELKKNVPVDFEFLNASSKELDEAFFEKKTEIIPALDERWLPPKIMLPKFYPFSVLYTDRENDEFVVKNTAYFEALGYLLNCNFHQFWCTIIFDKSAAVALRSFLLNPILPFQIEYLRSDCLDVYKAVFNRFLSVYEKLLTFEKSEIEYMPQSFGLSQIIEKKLLNLPIVITLAVLYRHCSLAFVNKIVDLYFTETTDISFIIKEVESSIEQNMIVLEMLGGHICGFDKNATIVPIGIENRPPIFSLAWIYSVVNYLHTTVLVLNTLFHFYKPAMEIALEKNVPFRLPFIYVKVYQELYVMLDNREEAETEQGLFRKVIDEINMGRSEFIELFHAFVSNCLDEALKTIGDPAKQENSVETYLKLLTTALEDEYFICDYNTAYNVATQNEMFESCCDIDPTRTEFIITCINKLPRNKKLQELSKLKRQTLENVFRDFKPPVAEAPDPEPEPGPSTVTSKPCENDIEDKIQSIIDMFPHLGDGYVLQCLEVYNFNTSDVINAILENNLPPHLTEIPFDAIRIPPEPEPEQPVLAYTGKKPQYDDALKLLNDKSEIREIKNMVLDGIQYNYADMYEDEYDDRDDDDVTIAVTDNPVEEEMKVFNPNRPPKNRRNKESESEEDESEDEAADGFSAERNKNFLEDPAVLRERREAKFRGRHPPSNNSNSKPKADVVGKPKGQGQEKSTLLNRQKKNVNKSSRANHNRKGGAQWKRNKGMIPS